MIKKSNHPTNYWHEVKYRLNAIHGVNEYQYELLQPADPKSRKSYAVFMCERNVSEYLMRQS
jgi:hypothetical protein